MKPDLLLQCDFGFLRPLELSDIHEGYVNGLNDPEVKKYLFASRSSVQTLESVSRYVTENYNAENAILFGIWAAGDKNFCGTLRVHAIEHLFGTAHIGICIFNKQYWGRGIGKQAVKKVCDWCFKSLNLRWLEAGLFSANVASKSIFTHSGFEHVCDFPDKYLLDGNPSPVSIYAAKKPWRKTD